MCHDIKETRRSKGDASSCRHRTIFYELLFGSDLPPEDPALDQLVDEGVSVVVSGNVAVTLTLYGTGFELLINPSKLATLRNEFSAYVAGSAGQPLSLQQFEQTSLSTRNCQ
jgi:hypothetical protein